MNSVSSPVCDRAEFDYSEKNGCNFTGVTGDTTAVGKEVMSEEVLCVSVHLVGTRPFEHITQLFHVV